MKFSYAPAVAAALLLSSAAFAAHAATIDVSTLQYNGSATNAAPGVIRLTDGANLADENDSGSNIGEMGSAFIGTSFDSDLTFTTSFTVTLTNTGFSPLADGITFIIQGNDPTVVGGGGGGVGASGIGNSIGVGFQSWDNNRVSIFMNGNINGGPIHNFNLGDQDDVLDVSIGYDGHALSYNVFNNSTGLSISGSKNFRLTNLGSDVYFGFTGATGLSYSIQDVSNWDLNVGAGLGAVPEPMSWALMVLGFGGMGGLIRRRRAALA